MDNEKPTAFTHNIGLIPDAFWPQGAIISNKRSLIWFVTHIEQIKSYTNKI
jgi:hypothetical protein